jgi:hypothetical protein
MKLLLERIIGNTVNHNSCVAFNPVTGDVAYAAGCVVVVYSPKRDKQVGFFNAQTSNKVTSVTYSSNGKYIAIGEVCLLLPIISY